MDGSFAGGGRSAGRRHAEWYETDLDAPRGGVLNYSEMRVKFERQAGLSGL